MLVLVSEDVPVLSAQEELENLWIPAFAGPAPFHILSDAGRAMTILSLCAQ
jgi:hypothetical protein